MAKKRFAQEEEQKIIEAIGIAEKNTSGEIRVHIESHCKSANVLDRAVELFAKLEMHKTVQRNGVLFYLAIEDHKFAIIGDKGINSIVGPGFWDQEKELMSGYFKDGQIVDGLVAGITEVGLKLREYFPYADDDINELSDDISYGG